MRKLFLFIRNGATVNYGIGTYIHNILSICATHSIETWVVVLYAPKEEYIISTKEVHYIYIPILFDEKGNEFDLAQIESRKKYYSYVIHILRNYISPYEKETIFQLNHTQDFSLAYALKNEWKDIKIVVTVHYFLWSLRIYENIQYLSNIIAKKENELTQEEKEIIYSSLLEQKLFNIADKLICMSDFSAQILEDFYEIPREKIALIPLGIKDMYFSKNKSTIRQQYGIPADEKMVLFVGRLTESKGIHILISAFRDILQCVDNVHLYIIGSGEYDRYLPLCHPSWRHITFCGKLPLTSVYDFYCMSNIGVIPSLIEQGSYVSIEMLMFGLPIIATDITGLQGKVIDGLNGYTIKVKEDNGTLYCSPEELKDKILSLLQKTSLTHFAKQSRKLYLKNYTLDKNKEKLIELYTSLWSKFKNNCCFT